MTNEQVKLSKLPASEIPKEKLFDSIPLAARVTSGVQNAKEMILAQRAAVSEKATGNVSPSELPPEARIKKITGASGLGLGFSKPLDIPDGVAETLKE